jgi:DNA-binding LytR/AlgR family response regulator
LCEVIAIGLEVKDTRVKLQVVPIRSVPETRNATIIVPKPGAERPIHLVGEREHRLYVLKPERIDYIEAEGNYVKFHSGAIEYISRNTMKRLSELLDGDFVRIERSLLVNILAIVYAQRVGRRAYAFVLASGLCLRSSPKYRAEILRAIPLSSVSGTQWQVG